MSTNNKNNKPDFMIICSPVKHIESIEGAWSNCKECGVKIFYSDESVKRIKEANIQEFPDLKAEDIDKYCGKCGLDSLRSVNDTNDIADPSDKQIQNIADHLKIPFAKAKEITSKMVKDIRSGKITSKDLGL